VLISSWYGGDHTRERFSSAGIVLVIGTDGIGPPWRDILMELRCDLLKQHLPSTRSLVVTTSAHVARNTGDSEDDLSIELKG